MQLRERNILFDISSLILFFIYLLLDDGIGVFWCGVVSLIVLFLIRFKLSPLSPFFYLSPASVYLVLNLIFLHYSGREHISILFCCIYLGLFVLSISFRFSYSIDFLNYTDKCINVRFFIFLYIAAVSCLLLIKAALFFDVFALFFKAVNLSASPIINAVLFGSLVVIAIKNLKLSLILSLYFLVVMCFVSLNSSDISRLSFLDLILLFFYLMFFNSASRFQLSFGIRWVGFFILFIWIFQLIYMYEFRDDFHFGGDSFIADNALSVIELSSNKHEPFMPFFNAFFILIPDWLWWGIKPKAYNASAWFISNVMGLDPELYPWGIGVSLFSAGYLYWGFAGVAFIFTVVGFFIGKLSSLVINPFWAGFLCYFLMRLPFAIYRMDETFLFGSFGGMLIMFAFFVFLFFRKINYSFAE